MSVGSRDLLFDCASGIAGDMFLAACLEVGLPPEVLHDVVSRLGLEHVTLEMRKARRGGIVGSRFRVLEHGRSIEGPDPEEDGQHPSLTTDATETSGTVEAAESSGRLTRLVSGDGALRESAGADPQHASRGGHGHGVGYRSIERLVGDSGLEPEVRRSALVMLRRLAEVEALMHGVSVDEVHFHEVGAVDSLVDLVGAAAAMHYFAPRRVLCGPVVVGTGAVRTAHGVLPVPSPAAAEILRGTGAQLRFASRGELVTPTGALILASFVTEFFGAGAGLRHDLRLEKIGYGLGRRELEDRPNAFRLVVGAGDHEEGSAVDRPDRRAVTFEALAHRADPVVSASVWQVEAQLDDVPGEHLAHVCERLLGAGALDVYSTPVIMKKGRPGTLVTVLARAGERDRLARQLLRESGSFGCRFHELERLELLRCVVQVAWRGHEIDVKLARRPAACSPEAAAPAAGHPLERWQGAKSDWLIAPEFEACRVVAVAEGEALATVYEAARRLAGEMLEERLGRSAKGEPSQSMEEPSR